MMKQKNYAILYFGVHLLITFFVSLNININSMLYSTDNQQHTLASTWWQTTTEQLNKNILNQVVKRPQYNIIFQYKHISLISLFLEQNSYTKHIIFSGGGHIYEEIIFMTFRHQWWLKECVTNFTMYSNHGIKMQLIPISINSYCYR